VDVHRKMAHQHHEQTMPNGEALLSHTPVDSDVPLALTAIWVHHRKRHTQAIKAQSQVHHIDRPLLDDILQHAGACLGQAGHKWHSTSQGDAADGTLGQVIEIDEDEFPLEPGRHTC